tara:strand:- start:2046 stop:2825 length:780 start_codon:yes stop_codon:yes gene_type:complete
MQITSEQLRVIIKEEVDRALEEISRREFCKIAGTSAAALAMGCHDYDLSDVDLEKPEGFPSCVQGVYFQPGLDIQEWEGGYPMDRFLAQFNNQEYTVVTEDASADAFGLLRMDDIPEVIVVQFHNVPEFSKSWQETLDLPPTYVAAHYELSGGNYAYLSTVTIAFPVTNVGGEKRVLMNRDQYVFEIEGLDWGANWATKEKKFNMLIDQDAYTTTQGVNPGVSLGDLTACRDAFKRYEEKTNAEYTTDPQFLPENRRFI